MKIGKVHNDILNDIILSQINKNINNEHMILGPSIGEDCSLVDFKSEYCVISCDPITGAGENIGKLAINVNINDIACSGAVPVGILTTILMPENSSEDDLKKIVDELYYEAKKFDLQIIGGHTEVTDAVNRPIISSTILGKTLDRKFVSSANAKPGDSLIMTKYAGIEGTYIIFQDKKVEVSHLVTQEWDTFEFENMLSILPEAKICFDIGVNSMHDITEGGVLGACYEIAECSNVGIEVYCDKIPVLDLTKDICEHFKINPLRLISSGALLLTCRQDIKNDVISALKNRDINVSEIGKITPKGCFYIQNGVRNKLESPESDELYKIF